MNKASVSAGERWRRIIAQQQRSGLSVGEFCRREHLAVSTCFAWKRRLAREARTAGTPFVQLKSASAPLVSSTTDGSGGSIELFLGPNRRLVLRPGFDPQTLAAALAVLEGSTSIREGR